MNGNSDFRRDIIDRFPCQLPPDDSFVSLSHAVTWIALRHSIAGPALSIILGLGKRRSKKAVFQDQEIDDAMAVAVRRLTDFGLGQKIAMHGRFFRDVLDDEIEIFTEHIPAVRLADFRWFDTLDDSLHRGEGLAWAKDRRQPCYPVGDDRHFRFVTVNRAQLMLEFPPDNFDLQDAPVYFTNAEIDDWILSTSCTGMKVARNAFMAEPRAKGLSATFEKRWNEIKQNKVGRPRCRKNGKTMPSRNLGAPFSLN